MKKESGKLLIVPLVSGFSFLKAALLFFIHCTDTCCALLCTYMQCTTCEYLCL